MFSVLTVSIAVASTHAELNLSVSVVHECIQLISSLKLPPVSLHDRFNASDLMS